MLAAFIAIFTYTEKFEKLSLARGYTESSGTTACFSHPNVVFSHPSGSFLFRLDRGFITVGHSFIF